MKPEQLQPYIERGMVQSQRHPNYPNLRIYTYTRSCQYEGQWDEITRATRGLILDTDTGEVVARPFEKFFNHSEDLERVSELVHKPAIIQEKYDGWLGILYWIGDTPYIATRGSFCSEPAVWASKWLHDNVDVSRLDKDWTYVFEIIHPDTRIVVDYCYEGLVYFGRKHRVTGEEDVSPISVKGIRDAVQHQLDIQSGEFWFPERENAEGYVLYWPEDGVRVKYKFNEYIRLHRIMTNVTPRRVWEALKDGWDFMEQLQNVPDEFYQEVKDIKEELIAQFVQIENRCLEIAQRERGNDRKTIAHRLARDHKQDMAVVFMMIDGHDYTQTIWKRIKP